MDQVYKLYIEDEITTSGLGKRYKPLEERLAQLQEQIPEMQAMLDFLKIQYLSSDQILHEAKDLYSRWPTLTQDEKRNIVENITEQIIVKDSEVEINLCYIPSPSEMMAKEQHGHRVMN